VPRARNIPESGACTPVTATLLTDWGTSLPLDCALDNESTLEYVSWRGATRWSPVLPLVTSLQVGLFRVDGPHLKSIGITRHRGGLGRRHGLGYSWQVFCDFNRPASRLENGRSLCRFWTSTIYVNNHLVSPQTRLIFTPAKLTERLSRHFPLASRLTEDLWR
jgi:hypothetical protein